MKKKELKGWVVVDAIDGRICTAITGMPLIFSIKTHAKSYAYNTLDKVKKVKIIIED